MYPQFEEELQIEHIQGYLYVQQAIENTATTNPGSMKTYAIFEIESPELELKKEVIKVVLDRLKHNTTILNRHHEHFYTYATFNKLDDWNKVLGAKLANWFADRYLHISTSTPLVSENIPGHLTEEGRHNWLQKVEAARVRANRDFVTTKPCVTYFLDLLKGLLGDRAEVWEFEVGEEMKDGDSVWFFMNLFWGMQFNLFLLKGREKYYLLHLGNVIN